MMVNVMVDPDPVLDTLGMSQDFILDGTPVIFRSHIMGQFISANPTTGMFFFGRREETGEPGGNPQRQ